MEKVIEPPDPDPLNDLYKSNFRSIHPDLWGLSDLDRLRTFRYSGNQAHELGQMIKIGWVRHRWRPASPKYKEIYLAIKELREGGIGLTWHSVVNHLAQAGRFNDLKDHLEEIREHCFGA